MMAEVSVIYTLRALAAVCFATLRRCQACIWVLPIDRVILIGRASEERAFPISSLQTSEATTNHFDQHNKKIRRIFLPACCKVPASHTDASVRYSKLLRR